MKPGDGVISKAGALNSLPLSPLALALEKLGARWTLLVLSELQSGPKRFHQLRDSLPWIPSKSLARVLDRLEKKALILRSVRPTRPPQVTYSLLANDPLLRKAILLLQRWGAQIASAERVSRAGGPLARAASRPRKKRRRR